MSDGQALALLFGLFLAVLGVLEYGRVRFRRRWIAELEGRSTPAQVSALSGPYPPPLPPVPPPPAGRCGPDISPAGSHRRLVADALLTCRGFDPAEERAGVNGSGVLDRAEREAAAVMAALRDGNTDGRWMA